VLAAAVKLAVNDNSAATSVTAVQDELADLAIGFVAYRGTKTEPLVRRLDATAGMARLSDSDRLILWRVLPRENASPSRLRLVDAQGAPLQSIASSGEHGRADVWVGAATPRTSKADPAAAGRLVVVAEPAQWADHARVIFAGRELSAVAGGGQPAYALPPTAGKLNITLTPTHYWWRWGQLGLLIIVLFLATPLGSSRSRRTR
jgi:hypothetical protein